MLTPISLKEFSPPTYTAIVHVEDIFWSFIIRYSLLTQTFGYRRMNVRVFGRSFNYVVAPEIYYTQVLV